MIDFDPIANPGVVTVGKPQGWTSHDVAGKLRRTFRAKKVGHSGILGPMAIGVLVLGAGRGTRFLPYVRADTRSYRATIRLGVAALTDDAEGELLSESSAASVTDKIIREKIVDLTGTITQKPAAVSAVKVDGVRAYERVRCGEKVDVPARPVITTRYEVLDIRHDPDIFRPGECIDIDAGIDCSAGMFIRVLARDLGGVLGAGGHLTALRCTAAGVFTIDEALAINELTAEVKQFDIANPEIAEMRHPIPDHAASLLPVSLDEACLRCFDIREVTEQQATDLAQGKWLEPIGKPGAYAAVLPAGKALALLAGSDKRIKTVFAVCPATLRLPLKVSQGCSGHTVVTTTPTPQPQKPCAPRKASGISR